MVNKRILSLLKWIITALILLGIVYNLILPFTPAWLDIAAWAAIAVAFLVALVIGRLKSTDKGDAKP
jgi:flagellar biosynthesis component FlhA